MATINNSTFSEGGTISVTGGTSKTLVSRGGNATRQEFYVDEDTVAATRRRFNVTASPSRADKTKPGGTTQERYTIQMIQPKQLASTDWANNTSSFTLAVYPETTDAERTKLADELLQVAHAARDLILKGNPS